MPCCAKYSDHQLLHCQSSARPKSLAFLMSLSVILFFSLFQLKQQSTQKARCILFLVMPAKAGIQGCKNQIFSGPRFSPG